MSAPSSDKAAIRQTIRALRAANHVLNGVNYGDGLIEFGPDATEDQILEELTAADEATLFVTLPDGVLESFIFFVLGNEPFEVICDHGVKLSPVLDPLTRKWWS